MITVQNICKSYGKFQALKNVSVEARDGQLVALLGPSGSGKTTLLRVIAGLEIPDSGQILFRDDDVTGRAARERNIGFVFQHYALFRHMTVFENIAFGLRVRKMPDKNVRERVHELLHLIRLDEMGHRYPSQLSGGQRQRVALARALAPQPHILLLDEPFGALDAKVRLELRSALKKLQSELRVTTLFVTHDQEEAFDVADEVVVMNEGKIEQAGPPLEVFEHPANAFVMDFLGNVNVLPALLKAGRLAITGTMPPPKRTDQPPSVYVPPHELDIERQPVSPSSLLATVVHMARTPKVVKVRLFNEEFGLALNVDLSLERAAELNLKFDEPVFVYARKNRPASANTTK